MNWLNTTVILLVALLVIFLQSVFTGFRDLVGAQPDLIPGLVVYVGLASGLANLAILSILAGLWTDALSANPLGTSILPLFVIGYMLRNYRGLILRNQHYAQWTLGAAASGLVPVLTLLMLWLFGEDPLLGWFSLWQWFVMILVGAAATPLWFGVFDRLLTAINYRAIEETSFRTDRQIKRGRM